MIDLSDKQQVDYKQIITSQFRELSYIINALEGSSEKARAYQELFQKIFGTNGNVQSTVADETIENFLKQIVAEGMDIKVEDIVNHLDYKPELLLQQAKSVIENKIKAHENTRKIQVGRVKKYIKQLQKIQSQLASSYTEPQMAKHKEELDKLIAALEEIVKSGKSDKSFLSTTELHSVKFNDNTSMNGSIVDLINRAYSIVNDENISNVIGAIGEYFYALIMALILTDIEDLQVKSVEELKDVLLNKLGSKVQLSGDQKSFSYRIAQPGEHKQWYEVEEVINDQVVFRTKMPTQDKVDIQVETSEGEIETFSVKSYSSLNEVHILSGSIRSLIDKFDVFYKSLLMFDETTDAQHEQNLMFALRFTIATQALIGRTHALTLDTHAVFSPPKAQYLITHDNQSGNVKVFYNKDILNHLKNKKNVNELISLHPAPTSLADKFYERGVDVGLRVAQLVNSLG